MKNDRYGDPDRPESIAPITEKQLARLWQRRAVRARELRTEEGRRVRVLYPGRPGVTAGPDFRNALLAVDGQGIVQGDVEVHLRQRDWRAHGHDRDPNYNGVALHVSLDPGGAQSRTDSGAAPPVVNVRDLLVEKANEAEPTEGSGRHLWAILGQRGYRRPETAEQMASLLNRAGDARFLWRSRQLQMLMGRQCPEQTLWESICEALGYRHNQHPFLMLATAAPIGRLTALARGAPAELRESLVAGLLLRLAGFGDGDERAGRPLPRGLGPALDIQQWRLFRVRPSNHPRRRVIGAAALIGRYAERGLTVGLARAAATGEPAALTQALAVADGNPALIGSGRARDIAVNAVLPFLHGWRLLAGDTAGAAAMLEIYRDFGPLIDNEITRNFAGTLQEPEWGRVANNARRQQGLIHLQRILAGAAPK